MDRLHAVAAKAWERVVVSCRHLERAGGSPLATIDAALGALREIHKEKAWCKPDDYFEDEETDLAFFEKELSLQGGFSAMLAKVDEMRTAVGQLAETHTANLAEGWADATQKEFARILNERRAALGLQPLRIEEKLSKACADHSREMTAMSYFSHTSPVPENATFSMRADNAGFQGAAGGECIFSGNASSAAAESAWWYSDGHRLINYSRGPDTLGIGPVGTMWTLNVGNMNR
jgi:uncharacterized protein YkwD